MKNNIIALAIFVLIASITPSSHAMDSLDKDSLGRELGFAARTGDLDTVEKLLEQGADVNYNDEGQDYTPLAEAIESKRTDIVSFLLQRPDLDVNKPSTERKTRPLTIAVLAGESAIIEQLLKAGADPNLTDDLGKTPLMAISSAQAHTYELTLKIIKQLLAANAKINAIDHNGNTALHYAVRRGNFMTIIALLAENANPTIKTIKDLDEKLSQETPLSYATRIKQKSVLPVLQNLTLNPEEIKYLSTALLSIDKTSNFTLPKDIKKYVFKPRILEHIAEEKMKKIEEDYDKANMVNIWNNIDKPMLKKALIINGAREFRLPQ